ncbi:MAG: glycosylhydrolase-like jelly roll fold domain-containing protein, partial [Terriglobia bacterium]
YAQLKLRLSEERLDFKVADDHYIAQSQIDGHRLRIAASRFDTLILPPMSTTRCSTAERVRDFFNSGGTVIALRRIPTTSVESGRNDQALKAIWEETFDSRPTLEPFRLKQNSSGGRAYFVPGSVEDLLDVLKQVTDPDVKVPEGPTHHLYVLHKVKDGAHLYWVVNDTPEPRVNVLEFRAKGRPERWNAHTGERTPLFYQSSGARTAVRLSLGPWDAAYVAFDAVGPAQPLKLLSTNLEELYVVTATENEVTVRGRAAVNNPRPLFVSLSDGQRQFSGEYQPLQGLEPLEITGEWSVTVEAPSISLPYALAVDDPGARGLRERWYAQEKDRMSWSPMWLSPMNHSIREWNVIGPFSNPEDTGLERTYPPEHTTDYEAVYKGNENRPLHWQRVNAGDYHVRPEGGSWNLGTMVITDGPYGTESFIVNYGDPLRCAPLDGTIYTQANVYSSQEADAVMILATPNPRAVFLNGTKVYSRWLRPLYNELTDGFAVRIPVHLRSGWNSVLLKFLHNPENEKPGHFTCRIERPDGTPIHGFMASPRVLESPRTKQKTGYRWLRFPVPALAGALRVPPMQFPWLAFIDNKQVNVASEIPLPKGSGTVTLRVASGELLEFPFAFVPITASLPLGTWKVPGMEYFSGSMIYEKSIALPASLLSERIFLDCGTVGVVTEVWVNGNSVGSRPWAPYVFEVTGRLRAGANPLKVRVANTAANGRAVATYQSILERIDRDGWYGPARLVPYVDREIRCQRV